jgi:hypothetical protein
MMKKVFISTKMVILSVLLMFSSFTHVLAEAPPPTLLVNEEGKVGINTDDPKADLHVNGTLRLQEGQPVKEISTDINNDSDDDEVPTAKAVKTYIDNKIEEALNAFKKCSGELHGTRWCDNQDGTVTDLTTRLVWLQEASWSGWHPISCGNNPNCLTTYERVNQLKDGYDGANLSDGSVEGDWRVPTQTELKKLMEGPEGVSTNKNRAFSGVQVWYWSSTANRGLWFVKLDNGRVGYTISTKSFCVWPVRKAISRK